ncbi:MAG: ABC transporter permease, partial [Hungatella sp.]|nr:ABC transporter permease [Hungatella sp.]
MMKQFSYRHTKEAEFMETMEEGSLFSFAGFNEREAEKTGYSNYSYWYSTFRAFLKNRGAFVLLVLLILLLAFTFIQPYLPGQYDPNMIINDAKGMQFRNIPQGKDFILGTNSIGQDLWAMIWAGTRTSLIIGLSVALAEAVIGITVGVIWWYVRKA